MTITLKKPDGSEEEIFCSVLAGVAETLCEWRNEDGEISFDGMNADEIEMAKRRSIHLIAECDAQEEGWLV